MNTKSSSLTTVDIDPYDVPEEYKQLGWRKCYSNREKRYYYFNKYSQESIWSLDELFELRNLRRDPLGICTPASTLSPSRLNSVDNSSSIISSSLTPTSDNSSYYQIRRSSQNDNFDSNSYTTLSSPASISSPKRFASSKPYWNLKLESNVIINERAMSLVLPPHPNIELFRAKLFHDFYLKFECLLMKNIPIDWTTSSLNKQNIRSIFNSLVIEFKMMSLKPENGVINEQLFVKFGNTRDESYLMNYLMKLFKIEIDEKLKLKTEDVLENCAQIYKDYIIKLIGSNSNKAIESLSSYDEQVNTWFKWSNVLTDKKKINDVGGDMDENLSNLRKKCESFLLKELDIQLNKIFKELNEISNLNLNEIYNQHSSLYKENNIKILTEPPAFKQNRKVIDYPLLICTPSLPLEIPVLEHDTFNSFTYLIYNNERLIIKTDYFVKLEQLYKHNCKDDEHRLQLFLARVWCLLKRYQILNEDTLEYVEENSNPPDIYSQSNLSDYQLYTLNPNVIEILAKQFHVRFEIFSNPFTSFFKQYCSLFEDTDGYFGSRGSFLNYKALSGSFLAILPYSNTMTTKCLDHIIKLLSASSEPLMFTIVLPLIKNEKVTVDKILTTSNQFCKNHFKLAKNSIELRKIIEYKCLNRDEATFKCEYDFFVGFLQNKEAEYKWKIFENNLDELKYEFSRSMTNLLNYSP